MRSVAALFALAATVLSSAPVLAQEQDYPRRPIRFIIGFGPGGIADLMARSLGEKLTEAMGQQVIVDNRPSAGGLLSMQLAGKAAPDGYTLLLGSSTQFSITPALQTNLPYDPLRDYTPIVFAALTPGILAVHPAHQAHSVQDLIKLARQKSPQAAAYASAGFGTAPYIAAELLKRIAGIEMTHVPYKGGGAAMVALLGREVPMYFGAVSTTIPHIRAARLRALGVTSLKRLSALPDVPTFDESGLKGFEIVQWFGVFGPARLPAPITNKLNETLNRILAAPDFKERFAQQGIELQQSTPSAFAKYVSAESQRWTRMLREMGIKEAP